LPASRHEETIERIVGFFRHAAQDSKAQAILYLLGPVGGGKPSLAERLKSLMEVHPIYVLKAGDELSPVFESPLSCSIRNRWARCWKKYGIHAATERADESMVLQAPCGLRWRDLAIPRCPDQPSRLRQITLRRPAQNENNQDISSLVGVDIRS
jgi:serine protein kinase